MNLALGLIAFLILITAATAMCLRKLVHVALLLVVTWFGIAAFYLWAGAEFIAFAQILIYAGAISMVVLFAVLLTRPVPLLPSPTPPNLGRVVAALAVGGAVAGVMGYAVLLTPLPLATTAQPVASVRELGIELMGPHLAAVLIVGLILTSALIGAMVIAASSGTAKEEGYP